MIVTEKHKQLSHLQILKGGLIGLDANVFLLLFKPSAWSSILQTSSM